MPRRCVWALMPLLFWGAAGCALPDPATEAAMRTSMRAAPPAGDCAVLDLALVERPVGDPYINGELWRQTDELIIDLERRAALEENGLRVGQLVGTPSAAFQDLVLSKRSCRAPKKLFVPLGRPAQIALGALLSHSAYELVRDKTRTEVTLDQAQYLLDLVATPAADGRIKFTFTPKVENAEIALPIVPSPDQSAWLIRPGRPCKAYPDLGWDVTLGLNQYLVIGGRLEHPRSLGHQAFVQDDGTAEVQQLLILRISNTLTPDTAEEYNDGRRSLPLALQAAQPAYRAKGP